MGDANHSYRIAHLPIIQCQENGHPAAHECLSQTISTAWLRVLCPDVLDMWNFCQNCCFFWGEKAQILTQGRSKGKAIDNHPTSFFQASRWKWPFPDLKGDFTYKNAIIPLCHHHFLRTKRAKKHPGRLTAGTYPEDHLPRPIIFRFHLLMFGAFTNPKQALHCTSSACVGSRCSSSARACAWSKKFPPCKPQIQKKKPAGY